MKNIHLFIALLMFLSGLISCQTIADLQTAYSSNTPNTYYKDIENKLNPWVFDDGISYLKIILVKKIKFPVWQYFEDCVIGSVQYKKNGIEIINTLNAINLNLNDPIDYPISGNWIGDPTRTPFNQYTSDGSYLKLTIRENDCFSDIYIRKLILNGQIAIQVFKRKPMDLHQICNPVIPGDFYYLIKQ